MKGHVSIELKDVKTGKIQKYVSENMVTNAVSNYLKYRVLSNTYGTGNYGETFPIVTNCLSGLLLFDETLEENANNIFCRAGLIGVCARDATTDIKRGTYNTAESGKTETGHRHVWDFNTSQCNGTIRALSLCHYNGGSRYFMPYIDTNRSINIETNWDTSFVPVTSRAPFYIDTENGYIYFATVSGTTWSFYKCKLKLQNFKVNDSPYYMEVNANTSELLATYTMSTASWVYPVYDTIEEKAYIMPVSVSNSIPCVVFNTKTKELSQITIDLFANKSTNSYRYRYGVHNGYIYYYSDAKGCVVRQKIGDTSDYHEYTQISRSTSSAGVAMRFSSFGDKNCAIVFDQTSANVGDMYCINPNTNEILKYDSKNWGEFWKYLNDEFVFEEGANQSLNNDLRIYQNRRYLGTIFNLPSPINKTDAQAMKITYELIDA